jgi:hypothetical protein
MQFDIRSQQQLWTEGNFQHQFRQTLSLGDTCQRNYVTSIIL